MRTFSRLTRSLAHSLGIVCAILGTSLPLAGARAEKVLRIAMTAADVPTSTGLPNNGFEGMRFLGYPIFEGLVLWDLTRTDQLAGLRPGLAERWEQAPDDKKTWIFHLRKGVKFHDGTDFDADAVIWNLDRYFNKDSPQFELPAAGMSRARVPLMGSYRKIDASTVAITTTVQASYFPSMAVYLLFTSPASFEKAGRDWAKVALLPAAGTGPFALSKVTPRQSAELVKFDGYWDAAKKAKLDKIILLPMPEATARVAALRPSSRRARSAGRRPNQSSWRASRSRSAPATKRLSRKPSVTFFLDAGQARSVGSTNAARTNRGQRR